MILVVRGIVWYGLYFFLVMLPLLTALVARPNRISQPFLVEVAVAAGFVGFSLMALEFSLISRIRAAAEPFGEDSLQLFHNLMGIVALGFVLAHPVLLILAGYPASCWLNPLASCANIATQTAALSILVLIVVVAASVWRARLGIRYELWQVTHGLFALFVVFAALVHIFIVGRYTDSALMQAVWVLYSVLVVALIGWSKVYVPLKTWRQPWEVVENREERGDTRTLVLKPIGHDGWSFEAGQFAWIKTGKTPFRSGQHPISLSSQGDVEPGGTVSLTIKDLGDWSGEEVPAIVPGDRAWLDGPHGVFTLERHQAMGFVLIGGGVGITPLHSMLLTMVQREDVRPVLVFYGTSSCKSMLLKESLDGLEASGKLNMRFIPVLSRPDYDWEGETGYVSAPVMKKYLPKQYKRFMYLICGPKPLMDGMEVALPELGVPPHNVLTERFDMI